MKPELLEQHLDLALAGIFDVDPGHMIGGMDILANLLLRNVTFEADATKARDGSDARRRVT